MSTSKTDRLLTIHCHEHTKTADQMDYLCQDVSWFHFVLMLIISNARLQVMEFHLTPKATYFSLPQCYPFHTKYTKYSLPSSLLSGKHKEQCSCLHYKIYQHLLRALESWCPRWCTKPTKWIVSNFLAQNKQVITKKKLSSKLTRKSNLWQNLQFSTSLQQWRYFLICLCIFWHPLDTHTLLLQ